MVDYSRCSEVYDIALEEYRGLGLTPWQVARLTGEDLITKDRIWMVVIVNGILAGKTWTRIAKDLDIDRSTLYDFRHRVELWDFVNSLLDEQLIDIATAKEKGDIETAMKFRNQILLALTPRRVRQRIESSAKVEFVYIVEEPDEAGEDALQASS